MYIVILYDIIIHVIGRGDYLLMSKDKLHYYEKLHNELDKLISIGKNNKLDSYVVFSLKNALRCVIDKENRIIKVDK